jgi:hypothetical protein
MEFHQNTKGTQKQVEKRLLPYLMLYGYMKHLWYPTACTRDTVALKSSSVSPQKPTIKSEVKATSGIMDLDGKNKI